MKLKEFVIEVVNQFLDEGVVTYSGLGDYIYHETNYMNAKEILKNGFKYGKETQKGEGTGGIYFSSTDKGSGVVYNRSIDNNRKRVRIEVSVIGLKLFDTDDLPINPDLLSFQQEWYFMVQNIENNGIFPNGYDGIIHRSKYSTNGIYQIILKKEVANKNLTGRVKNLNGKYIDNFKFLYNNN